MVSVRVPFNADNPETVALKHIEEEPPKPSDFVPDIPAAMDDIILRALKKSKTERYDSALQMIAELDLLKKGLSVDSDTGSQQDIFATRVIGSLEDENLAGQKTSTKIKKNKKKKKEEKPGKKRAAVAMVYVVLIGLILGGLWLVFDFVVRDLVEALFAQKVTPVEVI